MAVKNICVLGAGLGGLASAVNVLRRIPKSKVTLVADKFAADTSSVDVGDAVWRPWTLDSAFDSCGLEHSAVTAKRSLIRNWEIATRDHLKELLDSRQGPKCGVEFITGYDAYTDRIENLENSSSILNTLNTYPVHKRLHTDELKYLFPSGSISDAVFIMTISLNAKKYLAWLVQELVESGRGRILKKRVENLGEVAGQYDVVVNCTGLGSRDLVGDLNTVPNRGQIVMVKDLAVKNYTFLTLARDSERCCYVYPRTDGVVIGGSYSSNNWNREVDVELRQKMMEDAREIVPSLENSVAIKDAVALRSERRGGPRVEIEILPVFGRSLKIVHNYGHGGSGVSLHWGCGQNAASLVESLLG